MNTAAAAAAAADDDDDDDIEAEHRASSRLLCMQAPPASHHCWPIATHTRTWSSSGASSRCFISSRSLSLSLSLCLSVCLCFCFSPSVSVAGWSECRCLCVCVCEKMLRQFYILISKILIIPQFNRCKVGLTGGITPRAIFQLYSSVRGIARYTNAFATLTKYVFLRRLCKNNEIIFNRKVAMQICIQPGSRSNMSWNSWSPI